MTGKDLTVARFGGAVLLTFALTACATPKQDEAAVSSEAATSAPSSASGAGAAAPGDSGRSTAVKPPVKTATGTKTTVTKTDPGPDRDSAFGPKFTIDANGNVVPIRKK